MGSRLGTGLGLALALLIVTTAPGSTGELGADGRFEERRSSHFVLFQDVDIDRRSGRYGSVRFERDVLAVLEQAHDRLADWLGLRPDRPVEVWVYDPAIFDRQFSGLFRFPAAGFYHGAIRVRGDVQLTRQLIGTLHHEYVHAALDAAALYHVPPAWVNEGLAEWFEARANGRRRLSATQWKQLAWIDRHGAWLDEAALLRRSFAGLPPRAASIAYLHSLARVDLLDRAQGARGLKRFIDILLRVGDVDRALARVYRKSTGDLDLQLRSELR